jgi:hypothetical protein
VVDEHLPVHEASGEHGAHGSGGDVHMPPNSIVPVCVAISLCLTFVGFVDQVRGSVGPLVWGIGLVGLIASCAAWYRGARHEYEDLPESLDGH